MGICDYKRNKVTISINARKSTTTFHQKESVQYSNSNIKLSKTSESIINDDKLNKRNKNIKQQNLNSEIKIINDLKRHIYKSPKKKDNYIINVNDISIYKCRNNDACDFFFQISENKENTKYKEHIYTNCKYKKFYCIICKEIINNFTKILNHKCFTGENKLNSLCSCIPLRNCIKCGKTLIWNDKKEINNKKENCFKLLNYHENEKYYFYCDNCNIKICQNHSPPPICRVCGCGEKLKGGIIQKCCICDNLGGIGWYCNLCNNGIEICENCLDKFNEIYFGPI